MSDYTPGDRVTFYDHDGDPHDAVVIDVFDRPHCVGPYLNLVYNPGREGFGANTMRSLECDTSVPHTDDTDLDEPDFDGAAPDGYRYEPGWSA